VSTSYDGANRPIGLAGMNTQQKSTAYVSGVNYTAHGAATSYQYANGLNVQYRFNGRLQPCSIEHFFPPGDQPQTPLEEDLYWGTNQALCGASGDNNDTVRSIEQWNGGTPAHPRFITFLQNFTYDGVNRLSSAQELNVTGPAPFPTTWLRQFNYDQYGNNWVSNSTGVALAGSTPTAGSNYLPNNQLVNVPYDAAGNQVAANGDALSYDAENRQASATEPSSLGGGIETYSYDAMGQRVIKSTSSAGTYYIYDLFGQLAAEYNTSAAASSPCQTCYLSYDHLGSVRVMTDPTGNVVARHDYLPFGEELQASAPGRDSNFGTADNMSLRFTGQLRDNETGLDYFNARYYASALGRFTSPDPGNAGADPANPQSWNGYAYVGNNPLVITDPSGMNWFTDALNQVEEAILSFFGGGSQSCDADFCATGTGFGDVGTAGTPYGGGLNLGGVGAIGGDIGGLMFTATGLGKADVPTVSTPPRPDWLNNITSIFGYDQRIPLPSCFGDFVNNTISNLFPFLPSLSNVSEEGLGVASRVAYNRALSYAASTPSKAFGTSFLRYPFKSSVFRGLLSKSASLAEAAPMAGVVTAETQALSSEVQSMKQGACQ